MIAISRHSLAVNDQTHHPNTSLNLSSSSSMCDWIYNCRFDRKYCLPTHLSRSIGPANKPFFPGTYAKKPHARLVCGTGLRTVEHLPILRFFQKKLSPLLQASNFSPSHSYKPRKHKPRLGCHTFSKSVFRKAEIPSCLPLILAAFFRLFLVLTPS